MTTPSLQPRILLVEDDEALRKASSACLRRRGYFVEEAGSAEEAIAFLAEPERPRAQLQLLVTDQDLPGRSGLELIRALRAIELERGFETELPVMVFSSVAPRIAPEARSLGAKLLLEKPCSSREFAEAVAKLVG